jgi:hypothetical protein
VWLAECCIDRSSSAAAAAGLSSIGRYLAASGGMIALVSDDYFRDLRCVYELASFCKMHQRSDELGKRLLLVSLEWLGVLAPCQRTALTQRERAWFADFRCSRARYVPCPGSGTS